MMFGTGTAMKRAVWLDFLPYANRLFAAGRKDMWNNADTFISVYSQGQGLLQSDVLGIPIYDFYSAFLDQHDDLIQSWTGKKSTFALKKLLSVDEPRKVISDVLSGLHNLYQEAKPFVLMLPSPQKWLQWLHPRVRPERQISLNEDDIEAAAMYLAEYLRGFSTHGLSAIVLEENDPTVFNIDQAIPLYRPILNLAKHYQWSVGLLMEGPSDETSGTADEIDFYLFRNSDLTTLGPLWEKGCCIGGGLNRNFWSGKQALPDLSSAKLMYGVVPEDAEPETVLSQLKSLR
jgi:hypothetical protein